MAIQSHGWVFRQPFYWLQYLRNVAPLPRQVVECLMITYPYERRLGNIMIILEHNLYSGVVVVVVKFEIKVDIGKCWQLLEQD